MTGCPIDPDCTDPAHTYVEDPDMAPDLTAEQAATLARIDNTPDAPESVRHRAQLAAAVAVGDMAADWWCPKRKGMRREECKYCVAEVAADAALSVLRGPDTTAALAEWRCPSCGATTRARMADQ